MDTLIKTNDLWKIYGSGARRVEALRGVTLEIFEGKITCIAGPSGSGKSTLLSQLGLLSVPSKGQILFHDKPMDRLSEIMRTKIRREEFGFIFQSQYLFPYLTALENTRLPLFAQDISLKEANQKAINVLNKLNLEKRIDFKVNELSGGEAQRVAIARALVTEPSILIADEPSSNIDSKLTQEFLELLIQLKNSQKLTVVLASHDETVISIAEDIYYLRDGQIQEQ
ncbi:MAG: ABC transporter ATP-binding protein [Candidatus Hodarchaeales archaeon]